MIEWEYEVLHYSSLLTLKSMGKKGWELVAVDGDFRFYFKCPMEENNGQEEALEEEEQRQENQEDEGKQETTYPERDEVFHRPQA